MILKQLLPQPLPTLCSGYQKEKEKSTGYPIVISISELLPVDDFQERELQEEKQISVPQRAFLV